MYATDEPARSVVAVLDPVEALKISGNAEIGPLAEEVKARLERALLSVSATRPPDMKML